MTIYLFIWYFIYYDLFKCVYVIITVYLQLICVFIYHV